MTTMTTATSMTAASAAAPAAARALPQGVSGRRAAVRTVLSTVERLVFRGDAMSVARANAWSAVQRDRERARQRAEAQAAMEAPQA